MRWLTAFCLLSVLACAAPFLVPVAVDAAPKVRITHVDASRYPMVAAQVEVTDPAAVEKRTIADLGAWPYPKQQLVPMTEVVHDRLTVEEALLYSARLRLPSDTRAEEQDAAVYDVLDELQLSLQIELEAWHGRATVEHHVRQPALIDDRAVVISPH